MAVDYDCTYGNVSTTEARDLAFGTPYAFEPHEAGCTEPWVTNLVVALMCSIKAERILETGAFKGYTTKALAGRMAPSATLDYCEIDPERLNVLLEGVSGIPGVFGHGDVLDLLVRRPDNFYDFVFLDDDHSEAHVRNELAMVYRKVRPGGLIVLHDVTGACAYIGGMVRGYGGIALDLPRLGPAGGLGIIQKPL